jgi:hypothetical protein
LGRVITEPALRETLCRKGQQHVAARPSASCGEVLVRAFSDLESAA